jgi:NitT/TauT family transport system substrate-binding protein
MRKQSFTLILITFVILAILLLYALREPNDKEKAGRTLVRLQLQWLPQAQFAGFYVAEANNYYAEEGLSVALSHGGPDINPIQRLVSDQADIATVTGDQVLVWQNNNPGTISLKAIGNVFNRNIAVFMSRKELGLNTPQSLIGKKVGVYPAYDTENILLCMLKKHGVSSNQVDIKPFPNLQEFLASKPSAVEVFPAYAINEPLLAQQAGIAVNIIDPEQFGVKFYSDTMVTTNSYLVKNRDVARRFIRASVRGWDFVRSNPDESLKIMYRVVGPAIGKGEPEKHQEAMMREAIKYLGVGPNKRLFEMEKSRWEAMSAGLADIGRIKNKEIYAEVCDFSILDEALIK